MKLPSFNPYLDGSTQPIGLARYLDVFFMNIGQLLVCNILFVLCCLPVVTIGPGLIALSRVCCTALRGKKISPVADFFGAVKNNLKPGLVLTVALVPLYLWLIYMGAAALRTDLEAGTQLAWFLLSLAAFLLLNAYTLYLLPLLAYMKADWYTVMKNAFLLCFAGKGYTLLGSVTTAAFFLAGFLALPKSIPLLALIFFSFVVYNGSFFGWKIIDQYIFAPYYEEHPEESFDDNY